MRIATWNVNSLGARLEKVEWWLDRAAPDVLLMQETKLSDSDAPLMAFQMAGYQLVHHGEGRWNGVAIAARDGIDLDDPITNFGDGPVRNSGAGSKISLQEEDFDPLLFFGRVAGAFTRLSSSSLANVTSGAGMVPTMVID